MASCNIFPAVLIVTCFLCSSFPLSAADFETRDSLMADKPRQKRPVCNQCQGIPGRDGRDGRDSIVPGPPGKPGLQGPPGEPGEAGRTGGGSVYIRWGRKNCSAKSQLLYEGVVGGSHYTHVGGASNYLCMPLNPIYDKVKAGSQGNSYVYGTEYETGGFASLFKLNLHDHDAPCAVCFAESRGSQMMIPARNVCPTDWTLEYKGYLMSDDISHKRTEFICVDSNATSTLGSSQNTNGALLYIVESHCGALPCPPYVQGNELTCAVCTK